MADHKNRKNMKVKKQSLKIQLLTLEENELDLLMDINRAQKFQDALYKETIFGDKYLHMGYIEQQQVQTQTCISCYKFSGNGDNMESFAGLFGMCQCMWQRYVARAYQPQNIDPFDMNNHNKLNRYEEIARKSQYEITEVRRKITEVRRKINNTDYIQKQVVSHVLSDEEIQNRLKERNIQKEKNKHSIIKAKSITASTAPTKKYHSTQGSARKQSTIF